MSLMSIYKRWCIQLPLRWLILWGQMMHFWSKVSREHYGPRKTVWISSQQGGVSGARLGFYYSASMSKNIAVRKLALRLWVLENSHIMRRTNVCKTEATLVEFQLNWSLMVPTLSPVRALQWRQEGSKSTWAQSWMTNWPRTQTQEIWEGWEVSTDRSRLKMFYSCLIEPLLTSAVKCWFGNLRLPKKKAQLQALYKTIGRNLNNLCHIHQVRGSQRAACLSARSSLHTVLTFALQKDVHSCWRGQIQSLFDIIAL